MPPAAPARYPLAVVALGASFISTAAVFVKYLSAAGVGETAIGAWRALLAAAVLFPLAALWGAPAWPGWRVWRVAVLAGLFFAIDLFVWHRSIVIIGAGVATILANTQIFWTTLLFHLAKLGSRTPELTDAYVSEQP